jgi:hypothetical protein
MLNRPNLGIDGNEVIGYNNVNALRFSTLKLIADSVKSFRARRSEDELLFASDEDVNEETIGKRKKHFLLGGLVDLFLTEPIKFDNDYAIYTGKTVGGKSEMILSSLAVDEVDINNIDAEDLKTFCHSMEYYTNWGNGESHRKELLKSKEYYDFLIESKGKTIVTSDIVQQAQAIEYNIMNGRYTGKYLREVTEVNNVDVQVYPQFALFGVINGINYKGKLDYLVHDVVNNTITIVDVKTTFIHSKYFPRQMEKLLYGQQLVGYYELVKYNYPNVPTENIKIMFLVESTNVKQSSPMFYEFSLPTLDVYKYGDGRYIVGFDELMHKYKWHDETNEWDYEQDVVLNNGVITL